MGDITLPCPSLFNDGKDFGYFPLQSREFRRQHGSPGVEYHVDVSGQQRQVQAHRFAHAPLDAVAFYRFAQDAARSQAHTRARAKTCRPLGEEIGHRGREVFTASLVHTLIISVLAQPKIALGEKPQLRIF